MKRFTPIEKALRTSLVMAGLISLFEICSIFIKGHTAGANWPAMVHTSLAMIAIFVGLAGLVSLAMMAFFAALRWIPRLRSEKTIARIAANYFMASTTTMLFLSLGLLVLQHLPDRSDSAMSTPIWIGVLVFAAGTGLVSLLLIERRESIFFRRLCRGAALVHLLALVLIVLPVARSGILTYVGTFLLIQAIAIATLPHAVAAARSAGAVPSKPASRQASKPLRTGIIATLLVGLTFFGAACTLPFSAHNTRLIVLERSSIAFFALDVLPVCGGYDIGLASFECKAVEPRPTEAEDVTVGIEKAPRGLVVVMIDALRHDRVFPIDGSNPVAPNIRELTASGLHFERLYAPTPVTRHALTHFTHGAYDVAPADEEPSLLFQWLREREIETHVVSHHKVLEGLLHGADSFDGRFQEENVPGGRRAITSEDVTARGLEVISSIDDEQSFFMFLHYFDPHAPYVFADGAGLSRESRYDALVAHTDRWVGTLIDEIEADEKYEDVAVLLFSDHGEEFGDHGDHFHQFRLYDESTRMVGTLYWPDFVEARSIEAPTSIIDLYPTITGVFDDKADIEFEADPPLLFSANKHRIGMVRGDHKVILDHRRGIAEVYDLATDPRELTNLADDKPELLRDLACSLEGEFTAQGLID